MRYILDTHTLIWALNDTAKIPTKITKVLTNGKNEILVSAVSFWELSLKSSIEKINLNGYTVEEIRTEAERTGFSLIDLTVDVVRSFDCLKADFHKDPFDRMLVWQSICYDAILITKDEDIKKYSSIGLKTIW